MADKIVMKMPDDNNTYQQNVEVKVTVSGEEQLKSIANTLDTISRNKNVQKYWKDQQNLINDTISCYKNFNNTMSKENAEELLKTTNALKAMANVDISTLIPDFDKLSQSLLRAEEIAGDLDSAFSVKNFKEAFSSFDALRGFGTDMEKFFRIINNQSDLGELRQVVDSLNQQLADARSEMNSIRADYEKVKEELSEASSASGIFRLKEDLEEARYEMENFKDQAKEIFSDFLRANGFSDYDLKENEDIQYYFKQIESGYMTAKEAINSFRTEYNELLMETYRQSGDAFGIDQLNIFTDKLEKIFVKIEAVSNRIDDIMTNGVIQKSAVNMVDAGNLPSGYRQTVGDIATGTQDFNSVIEAVANIINNTQTAADGTDNLYKALAEVLTVIKDIGGIPLDNIDSLDRVLRTLGRLDELKIDKTPLENLRIALVGMSQIENASTLNIISNIDLSKFNDLKISKASLANLAEYLPKIADVNVDTLTKLSKIDFENLSKVKVSKESMQDLADFVSGIRNIVGTGPTLAGTGAAEGGTESIIGSVLPTDAEFSDVLSNLDLTKSKLGEIVKIVKKANADSDGKFYESFTLTDRNGSTETYGESSNTDKGQLLSYNYVVQDTKAVEREAAKENKRIIEENIRLNKDYYAEKKKQEEEYQRTREKYKAEGKKQEEQFLEIQGAIKKSRDEYQEWEVELLSSNSQHTMFDYVGEQLDILDKKLIDGKISIDKYWEEISKIKNKVADFDNNEASKNSAAQSIKDALFKGNVTSDYLRSNYGNIDLVQKADERIKELNSSLELGKITLTDYYAELQKIKDGFAGITIPDFMRDAQSYGGTQVIDDLNSYNEERERLLADGKAQEESYYKSYEESITKENELCKSSLETVQKYIDAVSELNRLKAADKNTGKFADSIKLQEEKVSDLKEEAIKARDAVYEMANPHNTSENTWKTWLKIMDQFRDSADGSAESVAKLKDALRNANNSTLDSLQREIDSYYTKYNNYNIKPTELNRSTGYKNALETLKKSIGQLADEKKRLAELDFINEEDLDNFNDLKAAVENNIIAIKRFSAAEKGSTESSRRKEIDKISKYLKENTRISEEAKNSLKEYLDILSNSGAEVNVEKIHNAFLRITSQERAAGREGKKFLDVIKDKAWYGWAAQIAGMFGIYDVINYGKQVVQQVIDIDSAITELRKVSNETDQRLSKSFENSAITAKDLGSSIKDVVSATADWSRMGYSISDSEELARVSTLYKNVGDGIDISAANESLISTLQGFQLDAAQAESIVDKFNEVANNYAIDSEGIGEALKRSAASFNAANTDLSKSIALITTTNEVVQDPESVGEYICLPIQ